jgi:3-dehydroquinate synthase
MVNNIASYYPEVRENLMPLFRRARTEQGAGSGSSAHQTLCALAPLRETIIMKKTTYKFSNSAVDYYFDSSFSNLKNIADKKTSIVITDENVFHDHQNKFQGWKTIVIKAGEKYKVQFTADLIISQLIQLEAERKTTLIGVGGGVITDLVGYVASVYLRGINFGFVPTSLLGMVDASIGGKNGIDVAIYKNMVGSIRQPSFLLYDLSFLKTLPEDEWENGFAEIIKHACIKNAAMFQELETNSIESYQKNKKLLAGLIKRNAVLKTKVVQKDEFEKGDRKLLNFGHTIGHALENLNQLSHGRAISIGMTHASIISEKLVGFKDAKRVTKLLLQYDLPTFTDFDKQKVFEVLKMDKKRERKEINFVLLQKIGTARIKSIPLKQLEKIISEL